VNVEYSSYWEFVCKLYTDRDAIWWADCVGSRHHVFGGSAQWHHVANRIEWPVGSVNGWMHQDDYWFAHSFGWWAKYMLDLLHYCFVFLTKNHTYSNTTFRQHGLFPIYCGIFYLNWLSQKNERIWRDSDVFFCQIALELIKNSCHFCNVSTRTFTSSVSWSLCTTSVNLC